MKRLESIVEKALREAIEAGEFDDLPGKGKPIDLRENPFEDPELRTAHRLLRNAGFAPAWIEERKDIDAQFNEACTKLKRAYELFGGSGQGTIHPEWERNLREFRELVAELNERLRIYNLKTPAMVFQRKLFDAELIIEEIETKGKG